MNSEEWSRDLILYRVCLSNAVFGLLATPNGLIVHSAPIGQWMRHKSIASVEKWIGDHNGTIERV